MTREECIQKIRHIQKSMYTFIFEDRKIHQFKADDADKFYYYLDMIVKYLDEDVPKEQEPFINKPCVSSGVCEHDKNKVLDKIRAEIMSKDGLEEALEIIDKYKAESEDKE